MEYKEQEISEHLDNEEIQYELISTIQIGYMISNQESSNEGQVIPIIEKIDQLSQELPSIPNEVVENHSLTSFIVAILIRFPGKTRQRCLKLAADLFKKCSELHDDLLESELFKENLIPIINQSFNMTELIQFLNSFSMFPKGANFIYSSGTFNHLIELFQISEPIRDGMFLTFLCTFFHESSEFQKHIANSPSLNKIIQFFLYYLQNPHQESLSQALVGIHYITNQKTINLIISSGIPEATFQLIKTDSPNCIAHVYFYFALLINLSKGPHPDFTQQILSNINFQFIFNYLSADNFPEIAASLLATASFSILFVSIPVNPALINDFIALAFRLAPITYDLATNQQKSIMRLIWTIMSNGTAEQRIALISDENVYAILDDSFEIDDTSFLQTRIFPQMYQTLKSMQQAPNDGYAQFQEMVSEHLVALAYHHDGMIMNFAASYLKYFFPDLFQQQGFVQ